ncbi:MAG: L-rhamnonate dehydratase [Propionibacteriaceae bacterium]
MPNGDRIVAVRASVIRPPRVQEQPLPLEPDLPEEVYHWRTTKVANPMTKYPEFRDSRAASTGPVGGQVVVVEVESASGHVGVATTNGGLISAAIIELHLAAMIVDQSPMAHERLWDRMFHSTLAFGRKGVVLHAISGVDLAVWDLHGRIAGEPVYALLGGPLHDSIPTYATGPSAANIAELGFWGAKLPLTFGPSEGEEGFRRNVQRARDAREAVGPDFPLLYDCWMALDVDYAVRLAWALEPLGFRWLEEPLVPDDYAGHAELRRRMPPTMTLNTGEHEYTAAGHKLLCEAGVDIVQPDPAWCGGLTELRRIATVATAYGKRVIPHVGGQHAYHWLLTYPQMFLAEFPVMQGRCDSILPQHAPLMLGETLPVDGHIRPSDAPGFGLELDPLIELDRPITLDLLRPPAVADV